MTLSEMIETIQIDFPDMNEQLLKLELNKALMEYVEATGILLTQEEFVVANIENGVVSLTLNPREILSVTAWKGSVYYNCNYEIEGQDIHLHGDYYKRYDKIRVIFRRYPELLSTLASEPDIPTQFHEALIWKVMWKISLRKGRERIVFFKSEWKEAVEHGIRYRNSAYNGRTLHFDNDYF
jgi:hypothetical protein